ncbi:hypothetical protein B0H12DRAFT_1135354 [Mycena haematopus]|nr:hypothetical protein B0H12DRAFT_1135354 [Mycena haematopus]
MYAGVILFPLLDLGKVYGLELLCSGLWIYLHLRTLLVSSERRQRTCRLRTYLHPDIFLFSRVTVLTLRVKVYGLGLLCSGLWTYDSEYISA